MSVVEDIHSMKTELNRWLNMEEEMWHQQSRNSWLKAGDKNTTFFHTKASNRFQRNSIERLLVGDNVWQQDEEQIGRIFTEYYDQLFTSSQP